MSLKEYLSTPTNNKAHPEEVLNVIRESETEMMNPPEIADELSTTGEAVRGYISDLESEGRVVAKKFGGENGTIVVRLASSEREEQVDPDVDRVARVCDEIASGARLGGLLGVGVTVLGALMLLAAAALQGLAASSAQAQEVVAVYQFLGARATLLGAFVIIAGGAWGYFAALTEFIASRGLGRAS
jgi:hypothetical protein